MMACTTGEWRRLAFDVTLYASVAVFVACSHFGVITPKKTGFFCDDRSIQFQYTGDTVPVRWLLTINIGVPLFAAILVETWHCNGGGCSPLPGNGFKPCLKSIGRIMLDFIIGKMFTIYLCELLKTCVSEHRPHFLDSCKPDTTPVRCREGFITNYTCTSSYSKSIISDSSKSFPSAHAASSFYTCVFLCLYFHIRGRWSGSRLISVWLYTMCMSWAFYCSISRITDHRHHWWDVLVGGILGTVFSITTVAILSEWFIPKSEVTNTLSEGSSAKPDKRVSTRRLVSSSSEPKEMEIVSLKNSGSNHV